MPTTREDLKRWFDAGKGDNFDFMIVVCDTFDHEDYPVHVSREGFWKRYDELRLGKNMQGIMEVYDLSKSWESQSNERVHNTPPRD